MVKPEQAEEGAAFFGSDARLAAEVAGTAVVVEAPQKRAKVGGREAKAGWKEELLFSLH